MKVSLQRVAEKGLSDQVTFEQRPGGREGQAGQIPGGKQRERHVQRPEAGGGNMDAWWSRGRPEKGPRASSARFIRAARRCIMHPQNPAELHQPPKPVHREESVPIFM